MKICAADRKKLARWVEIISKSGRSDEATLCFTPARLECRVLDPSAVSMIYLNIPKEQFTAYPVKEQIRLGIDITRISPRLKIMKSETVEIEYDKKISVLRLKSDGSEMDIPLLEPAESKSPSDLKSQLQKMIVNGDDLIRALNGAALIKEYATFKASGQNLYIFSVNDRERVETVINIDKVDADCTSNFDISYMLDAVKSFNSGDMSVYIGDDLPLVIEFDLGEYFIAPQVVSD